MPRRIIDNADGIITYSQEDADGNVGVGEMYDAEPLLDRNKALQTSGFANPHSEIRPVASIPITLIRQWVQEDGILESVFWRWPSSEQRKFCAKKYLSSDYQYLRTAPQKATRIVMP